MLIDSSAWIEYLRATGSRTHMRLREIVANGEAAATTEVVVMELLAGTADEVRRARVRRLLGGLDLLSVGTLATYESAADLYRACRRNGETIRRMTDCLIAAVAIRDGVAVLHADRDFDAIARHSPLVIA